MLELNRIFIEWPLNIYKSCKNQLHELNGTNSKIYWYWFKACHKLHDWSMCVKIMILFQGQRPFDKELGRSKLLITICINKTGQNAFIMHFSKIKVLGYSKVYLVCLTMKRKLITNWYLHLRQFLVKIN